MSFNLQYRGVLLAPGLLLLLLFTNSCSVYLIDKDQLQARLSANENCCKEGGLKKLLSTYHVQYNNKMDSISYFDAGGALKKRPVKYDTRLRVVTRTKGSFWMYARTLFIWKGEYLVGERGEVKLKNTGYLPVPICEIERIEIRG